MSDNEEKYDIEMLASMIDDDDRIDNDDDDVGAKFKRDQKTAILNQDTELICKPGNNVTQIVNKKTTSSTDDLELELKKMQERMIAMQEQLIKMKSTDSPKENETPLKTPVKTCHGKLKDIGLEMLLGKPSTSRANLVNSSTAKPTKMPASLVHSGDTDSSDEESNRNPMTPKYNEYGQSIRKRLAHASKKPEENHSKINLGNVPETKLKLNLKSPINENPSEKVEKSEMTDPFSGIKIINPKISSLEMRDRMEGRKMIRLSTIRLHIKGGDIEGDWVTIAVIVNKTEAKKSTNGNLYSIWKISDLKDCSKIVSLFLFGKNHEQHWKTSVGSVVGILNASIMPNKDSQSAFNDNGVCLTIDNPQKVMLMGISKDFGHCKSRRKDGASCTMFVNKADCEFCPFHIQKEYRKSSSNRMDLQTNFSGHEPNTLRAKILQNQQVIYGGQLYVNPRPDKPQRKKVNGKDVLRLDSLKLQMKANEMAKTERVTINAAHLSIEENKLANDIGDKCEALGKMMCLPTAGSRNLFKHLKHEDVIIGENKVMSQSMKSITPSELLKIHAKEMESKRASRQISTVALNRPPTGSTSALTNAEFQIRPMLGRGMRPGAAILLDAPITNRPYTIDYAKLRAIKKIQKPIVKANPNSIKRPDRNSMEFQEKIKKRIADENLTDVPQEKKNRFGFDENEDMKTGQGGKPKLPEKVLELLNRKSKYEYLANEENEKQQAKYFNEMEKKEQIEAKMCSTMEVECRAVSCKKCDYTAFSALESCRANSHPLIVHKAKKRFFKCKDCSRRTVSLTKLPNKPCSGCRGNNYEKVAMCKERAGPKLESEILLIRGAEQMFVNSHCIDNL